MPLPIVVADTTVLIALHHLEHLPKLSLFYHQVLIPAAVRAEFLSKDERKNRETAFDLFTGTGFFSPCDDYDTVEVTHLRNDIGFRVTDQVVHSALQEASRAFAGPS